MPTEYVSLAHVKHLPETAVLSATYTVAHAPCMLANRAASTSASESKPAELLRYKVCAVFEINRNPACLIQQKQQPRLFLRRRETHCTHAAAEKAQAAVPFQRQFRAVLSILARSIAIDMLRNHFCTCRPLAMLFWLPALVTTDSQSGISTFTRRLPQVFVSTLL